MKITLTSTDNQKNSSNNNNMTSIDLGECEDLLRDYYNISSRRIFIIWLECYKYQIDN